MKKHTNGKFKNSRGKGEELSPHGKSLVKAENKFFVSDLGKPILMRRKLTTVTTFSTTTGSTMTIAITSGNCTATTEWANLSANYQQYRVRAVKITLIMRTQNNMNSAAQVWYPGTLISGRYPVGSGGSTAAAVFSEDGASLHPQWTVAKRTVTWESNEDAKLWTNCNAAIPALSLFGVQVYSTMVCPATYNTIITHDCFYEFDVEFLGRN